MEKFKLYDAPKEIPDCPHCGSLYVIKAIGRDPAKPGGKKPFYKCINCWKEFEKGEEKKE